MLSRRPKAELHVFLRRELDKISDGRAAEQSRNARFRLGGHYAPPVKRGLGAGNIACDSGAEMLLDKRAINPFLSVLLASTVLIGSSNLSPGATPSRPGLFY